MCTYRLHICRLLLSLVLVCAPIQHVAAQDKPRAELPEFDVATVKPIGPDGPHTTGVKVYPGGRVVISGLTLKGLVTAAFRVSYWQISGGDSWTGRDVYIVEAKPAENQRSSIKDLRYTVFGIEDEHLRDMLQALLIDRFQLKFHQETKTGDVYRLERSGTTLKLRPAGTANDSSFGSVGYVEARWRIFATTMPQLAQFAADHVLHAPVLDRTELSGSFDYEQPVPDPDPNYSDNSSSFLHFIPELGLKLERTKGPVTVFMIDQAAKPSPN